MRFRSSGSRPASSAIPTRPPPGPRTSSQASSLQSSTGASPTTAHADFTDARLRWFEMARDRRSGLSLASDEMENAANSMDSISLGENGVRHGCMPPPSEVTRSLRGASATSDSGGSVPSANPSPISGPRVRIAPQPQTNHETTPATSPAYSRPSLSDYGNSPGPSLQLKFDYAELTALKEKFNLLDSEGKGFLSRTEFYDLFSLFLDAQYSNDGDRFALFNFAYSLFLSSDERLYLKEFVTGMTILSKGSEADRLRFLFMMYDTDNSGHLNADEVKGVFRIMSSYATSHDFKASDSLDAQSLATLRRGNADVLEELAQKTIRLHDTDGDGKIGFEDFEKWCASDPVVKTWMDLLCLGMERGMARLRDEREKALIARELDSLGIADDFWKDSFQLHPASSSTAILPPNITAQAPATAQNTEGTALAPGMPHGGPVQNYNTDAELRRDGMGNGSNRPSHIRSDTQNAIGGFNIDYREIKFEEQIGSGSFAVVYKCKWLDSPVGVKVFKSGAGLVLNADGTPATGQVGGPGPGNTNRRLQVNGETLEPDLDSMAGTTRGGAMSQVDDTTGEMSSHRIRFLQEVSLLKSIRHPNLLLYMGACVNPQYPLCIVSELINGGSLFELLHGQNRVSLNLRQKLVLMHHIALGMRYLHGRDPIVLHRDLKSANILVELQNDDSFEAKIIDFGLSKLVSAQASLVPGAGRGMTGSLVTMAPEVMKEQQYQPRSDVYSFGIVCWEIFCGRVPFGTLTGVTQLVMKVAVLGERPEILPEDNVPAPIQCLIRACWDQDIDLRPDFLVITRTLHQIRLELGL